MQAYIIADNYSRDLVTCILAFEAQLATLR